MNLHQKRIGEWWNPAFALWLINATQSQIPWGSAKGIKWSRKSNKDHKQAIQHWISWLKIIKHSQQNSFCKIVGLLGFKLWLVCFYTYIHSISNQHEQYIAIGSNLLSQQSMGSKKLATAILFNQSVKALIQPFRCFKRNYQITRNGFLIRGNGRNRWLGSVELAVAFYSRSAYRPVSSWCRRHLFFKIDLNRIYN